jgi:hypothetical protein
MFLSEDENFLLFFRLETPLDNSVEFMQVSTCCLHGEGGWDCHPFFCLVPEGEVYPEDTAKQLSFQENLFISPFIGLLLSWRIL